MDFIAVTQGTILWNQVYISNPAQGMWVTQPES